MVTHMILIIFFKPSCGLGCHMHGWRCTVICSGNLTVICANCFKNTWFGEFKCLSSSLTIRWFNLLIRLFKTREYHLWRSWLGFWTFFKRTVNLIYFCLVVWFHYWRISWVALSKLFLIPVWKCSTFWSIVICFKGSLGLMTLSGSLTSLSCNLSDHSVLYRLNDFFVKFFLLWLSCHMMVNLSWRVRSKMLLILFWISYTPLTSTTMMMLMHPSPIVMINLHPFLCN